MTIDGKSLKEIFDLIQSNGVPATFTVDEWCARRKICKSFYFKLQREGRGPRVMRVGARTLISREADDEWRRECEFADTSKVEVAAES